MRCFKHRESVAAGGKIGSKNGRGSSSARGYRARAKQLREEAAIMANLETQQALLDIAAHYERLASQVEMIMTR